MNKRILFLLSFVVAFGIEHSQANVSLPKALSSNMILQRNAKVPIWGYADAGEKITVSFAGQTLSTKANSEGKWDVLLKPLKLNNKPSEMTISGNNTITLTNVLVGDVWLCSGQSNMEYPLDYRLKKYAAAANGTDVALEELSKPKSDQIRYLYVEKQLDPKEIKSDGWITAKNDVVLANVSAAGYFFAKEIYEKTKVPIGIISSSWGGTRIEEWTPGWAYEKSDVFKHLTKEKDFKINDMKPGRKFEGMLSPIIPYAIKGMLWYQGESNCTIEDQQTYSDKFELLVATYRSLFKNPKMPVYYVQIAPHLYSKRTKDKMPHSADLLPQFWEAQKKGLSIPNTAMVVTTDLVDKLSDIHPSYKWVVGHRLALCALTEDYGEKVIASGPVYKSMKTLGNKIILSFDNKDGGLVAKDGLPLSWFTIAPADGKYVEAKAEIQNDKVVVWSDEVQNPQSVRFAWNERAMPNLFNKEGLPAVPFSTNGK